MNFSKAMAVWLSTLFLPAAITTSTANTPTAPATTNDSRQTKPATNAGGAATNLEPATSPCLFAYFRQRYETRVEIDTNGVTQTVPLPEPMREEQLHYALSTDGRHWTPLNSNRPVWTQRLRDPYLQRGPDALWRLLATGGNGLTPPDHPQSSILPPRPSIGSPGNPPSATLPPRTASAPSPTNPQSSILHPRSPVCLYAESRDLLTWTNVHALPLMTGIRDETDRAPRNLWAPEWFYDAKNGDYFIFWSSSFEDAGWKKSRLWYCRTRDWQTFTEARVLFHPPYSVIDGTLLEHDGTYYLFHKEEEFGATKGERRAIRLATADKLEGPYKIFEGPLNQGQIAPTITEGPEIIPDPIGLLHQPSTLNNQLSINPNPSPQSTINPQLSTTPFLLLYDYCMSNAYGASASSDLLHWSVQTSVSFPPDARHGCFTAVTPAEAERLRTRFR